MASDKKREIQFQAFQRFLNRRGLPNDADRIRELDKGEGISLPDFAYIDLEGEVAFEVTAVCEREIGKMLADSQYREIPAAWTGGEPETRRIVRQKLEKTYQTPLPLELVCYWDGGTVATDDQILAVIRQVVDGAEKNPFRKIWYDGDERLYSV